MYLIAIAWFYVALLAAISDDTVIGGVLTFIFYGLAPLALFLWLFGTPTRRRRQLERESAEDLNDRDDSSAGQ
jgi:membrane protein implicated in regulation of membrane protease activity